MFRDVNVLIVEDNTEIRSLLRRIISAMTFCVDTTDTLRGAMGLLDWADILVVDLKLPNGSGDALLERWTELHKGPVVVCSGYIDRDLEYELLESRAWNVLPKPIKPSVVRSVLHRYGEYIIRKNEHIEMQRIVKELQEDVIPSLREELDSSKTTIDQWKTRFWLMTVVAASAGAGIGFGIETIVKGLF